MKFYALTIGKVSSFTPICICFRYCVHLTKTCKQNVNKGSFSYYYITFNQSISVKHQYTKYKSRKRLTFELNLCKLGVRELMSYSFKSTPYVFGTLFEKRDIYYVNTLLIRLSQFGM